MESSYFLFNPWWEGAAPATGIRRETYLRPLVENSNRRQVEILLGSRRVGKTTILRQIIGELQALEVSPRDICFLALDHPALSFGVCQLQRFILRCQLRAVLSP